MENKEFEALSVLILESFLKDIKQKQRDGWGIDELITDYELQLKEGKEKYL